MRLRPARMGLCAKARACCEPERKKAMSTTDTSAVPDYPLGIGAALHEQGYYGGPGSR